MSNELALIKGRAVSESMSEDISETLDLEFYPREIREFPDGETYCRIKESIRGDDCFIVNSLVQTETKPTEKSLIEVLLILDVLKRAGANKKRIVVLPYYGYSRQDRKVTGREPVSAALIANVLSAAGATGVVTVDLHAGQIQGFFDGPVVNLSPVIDGILVSGIETLIEKELGDEIRFGAIDVGGMKRVKTVTEKFPYQLVGIEKDRKGDEDVEPIHLIGTIDGHDIIIIDDIVSTAGTLVEGANFMERKGAEKITAVITHGIFADQAVEKIEESPIQRLFVTDTIPPVRRAKQSPSIEHIRIGEVIGKTIKRIYEEKSVSKIFSHT